VIEIRAVGGDDAAALRELRLRALRDAPEAFGSTLAEEQGFAGDRWTALAAASAVGDAIAVFAAVQDGRWVGMGAGRWFDRERGIAQLWGMWVEPAARGQGLGERLVAAARDWASSHGARFVRLGVAGEDAGALGLYERLGFVRTYEDHPLGRDPALTAVFLVRPV
jgi:ribosomal protein S18 acetylase RimI-like enzyme